MTYRVKYTDLTKNPILVQDGDVDTTTNLGLVGRGYTGFGEVVAENFLHLLENFADETPPTRPTPGQMWYDNNNSVLYYYTIADTWKKVGDVRTAATAPITNNGEVTGDFWLNTVTNDLYMFNDPNWVLMSNGDITTKVYTRTRLDINNVSHKTLEMVVNGEIVAIFSGDTTAWVPNSTEQNAEYMDDNITLLKNVYSNIRFGLNLIDRKTITEVTVTNTNPNTTNPYLRTGDMWVNSSSGRLFSYNGSSWDRLNSYVKVRAAVPIIENDEQSGDIWINTLIGKMYFYNSTTATWDILGAATTLSAVSPQITDVKNIGDYWVNTTTQQLFVYNGGAWINLSFQELGTFERSIIRKDINNVDCKVLETIVNGKTISVAYGGDGYFTPNASEILYEGNAFNTKFPIVYVGINASTYVGTRTLTTSTVTEPTAVEYSVWISTLGTYPTTYPSNIKIRNASNSWISPTHTYEQITTPATPTPVKYDYWLNPVTLTASVFNGSSWATQTPIVTGETNAITFGSHPTTVNGIALNRAMTGTYSKYYASFTALDTFSDLDWTNVMVRNAQWTPIIKGLVTIDTLMTSITNYTVRVVRRPLDLLGNPLVGAQRIIATHSNTFSSSAGSVVPRIITLSFADVIGTDLHKWYDTVASDGPFEVQYAIQILKVGAGTLTSSTSTIDLEQIYRGVTTSSTVNFNYNGATLIGIETT